MIRVGLVGPADREEIDRLAMRLEERSAEAVVLDTRDDLVPEIDGERILVGDVDLGSLRGLYVGDLGLPQTRVKGADGGLDIEASRAALAYSCATLAAWNVALERLMRRMPVINPPATYDLHGLKPLEVGVYRQRGWAVPETVATSDPRELVALGAGRAWVRKGLIGGYTYTEAFEPPSGPEQAARALGGGAALVQERVEGDAARAFVVGGHMLVAATIVTQTPGEVDSRRGPARLRALELPDDVRATVEAVVAEWGMRFAAVDLMQDARHGGWKLLECNSSPFFVELERSTGCDLSSALADELLGRGRRT